tara:strand:+ start:15404 stop:16654 length:1251 start_codon:yes stop_codon:yes gene_type:complete
MKKIIFILQFLLSFSVFSQQKITLQECYDLVQQNYPLAQQTMLLEKQTNFSLEALKTEKLPQFDLASQATYQSDVIEVPIPNSNITPLNKDQYRATLNVHQLIYGGGQINAALKEKKADLLTKQKQIEVNLYGLKSQVNQLYFSILLVQEKEFILKAKKEQLQEKLSEVQSGIKNGMILPSSDKVLQAELLKLEQAFTSLKFQKENLYDTLSALLGIPLDTNISLDKPMISISSKDEIQRPEIALFDFKKSQIEASEELLTKQTAPKLMGFATGGYGNPGLNMLDNSFQGFYITGVKLNWKLFDWNAVKKKRDALAVSKEIFSNEAEIFDLQTHIALQDQQKEIEKLEAFISTDSAIIALRNEVLETTASQLKNGVITSSVYITELTNLYEDQNALSTHKIELLLAKANYNTMKGN